MQFPYLHSMRGRTNAIIKELPLQELLMIGHGDEDKDSGTFDGAASASVDREAGQAIPAELNDPSGVRTTTGPETSERVGYGRPPANSQFQPGRSGNPRGRPRGVKSVSDIVRKIAGQTVTITENGRTRRVPRLEAILLRVASEASRGDAHALRQFVQLTERYGESAESAVDREAMAAEDIAILRRYLPDVKGAPVAASDAEADGEAKHDCPI